jgi:hypothetical protein
MMEDMETRAGKDAKTLAIARALTIFVLVMIAAGLLVYVASRLGVRSTDAWVPVTAGVAALLSISFLVRHRDD